MTGDCLDITHARYPIVSFPRGLFLCACDDCARTAATMGYEMEEMKEAMHPTTGRARSSNS
jgi:hypothetical protein